MFQVTAQYSIHLLFLEIDKGQIPLPGVNTPVHVSSVQRIQPSNVYSFVQGIFTELNYRMDEVPRNHS